MLAPAASSRQRRRHNRVKKSRRHYTPALEQLEIRCVLTSLNAQYVVELQTHDVAFGDDHLSILITPQDPSLYHDNDGDDFADEDPLFRRRADGSYALSLGAGAEPLIGGNLVARFNRTNDIAVHVAAQRHTLTKPAGFADSRAWVNALISRAAGYRDNLEYVTFPELGLFDGFNSNSYIAGLLAATGTVVPDPATIFADVNYPGYATPVPAANFGTADAQRLDLIFVIDTTASMFDDIDAVKDSATEIIDRVHELFSVDGSIDARVAVVDYRDHPVHPFGSPGDYPFNDVQVFAGSQTAAVDGIQRLSLGDGNDFEESVYSGLMHAIDSTSLGLWRGEGVNKVIIVMGDAPPHDPEPITGFTASSVITAAQNEGLLGILKQEASGGEATSGVRIIPVVVGNDSGAIAAFQAIADGTNGTLFQALTASEVVDALLAAIDTVGGEGNIDTGDAPESYGTLLADDGPTHGESELFLGTTVDYETDGLPSDDALGDDNDGDDDEDGVTMAAGLLAGASAKLVVTSSGEGYLDAWIDYNGDGDFGDEGEQVATSLFVFAENNSVLIDVPESAVGGGTFARFRLSSTGGLGPTGPADDGEVEDYAVQIVKPAGGSSTIIDDPLNPGHPLLVVTGTSRSDVVTLTKIPGFSFLGIPARTLVRNATFQYFADTQFERVLINTFDGADVVLLDSRLTKPTTIFTGLGNDIVTGSNGPDQIHGGGGSDLIFGRGGNDVIFGGDGNDFIYGEGGDDIINGGAGADFLVGGSGRDILIGGLGVDTLHGSAGEDLLIGSRWNFETDLLELLNLRSIWTGPGNITTRVDNLRPILTEETVPDDGVADQIWAGINRDWIIDYALRDRLWDYSSHSTLGDKRN